MQRSGETATLLGNGQVLIAGGRSETAEVFDPASGQFTLVGNMSGPRTHHTATLLASGKVWIAGGDDGITTLATTEIYDPSTGTFTPSAGMSDAREGHTATRFVNGQVLVVGGTNNSAYLATGEIYDPAVGAFVITGSTVLSHNDSGTRALHTATRLADGTVIICGGMTSLGITARGLLFIPQP
jgi:hypothetical protein